MQGHMELVIVLAMNGALEAAACGACQHQSLQARAWEDQGPLYKIKAQRNAVVDCLSLPQANARWHANGCLRPSIKLGLQPAINSPLGLPPAPFGACSASSWPASSRTPSVGGQASYTYCRGRQCCGICRRCGEAGMLSRGWRRSPGGWCGRWAVPAPTAAWDGQPDAVACSTASSLAGATHLQSG